MCFSLPALSSQVKAGKADRTLGFLLKSIPSLSSCVAEVYGFSKDRKVEQDEWKGETIKYACLTLKNNGCGLCAILQAAYETLARQARHHNASLRVRIQS